jgi:hypothetical protein
VLKQLVKTIELTLPHASKDHGFQPLKEAKFRCQTRLHSGICSADVQPHQENGTDAYDSINPVDQEHHENLQGRLEMIQIC